MVVEEGRKRRLVFLVSYPKSGNTWVRLLLGSYFFGHEEAPAATFIDTLAYPFMELTGTPIKEMTVWEHGALHPAAMFKLQETLPEDSWALVKSHHANAVVAGIPLFAPLFCHRAIVIVRDPRDVLPSIAAHMGMDHETAVELMAAKNARMPDPEGLKVPHITGSWSTHVGSWLRQRRVTHKVIKYEELHADTPAVLIDMLKFLGEEEPDPTRVEVAVRSQNFDALHDREDRIGFGETSQKAARFFRRGIVGGWRDEVQPHLIERLEAEHVEVMERMGYQLEVTHV